ncbi:MAG: hypothetical protein ACOY3P_01125 [Planctomycetota bacterium]
MTQAGCLLLQTDRPSGNRAWRLAILGDGDPAWLDLSTAAVDGTPPSVEVIADEAARFVAEHGLSRRRVVVALASTAVLCGSAEVASAKQARNRRALAYQLEDVLPIAAEDAVMDFIVHKQRAFGVAVDVQSVLPLIAAIESRGLSVQSIVPAALLGLQSLLGELAAGSFDLIVWETEGALELFDLAGRVTDWRHFAGSTETAAEQVLVEISRLSSAARVLLVHETEGAISESPTALLADPSQTAGNSLPVAQLPMLTEHIVAAPLGEFVRRASDSVVRGTMTPWIELRRGPLSIGDPHRAVRRDWRMLQYAAALFLLALTAFGATRAQQYRRAAGNALAAEQAAFRQAFPESPSPAAVLRRLESEYIKLRGARSDEAKVLLPPPALNVLHAVVSALPQGQRFRVEQIRIENGRLDLDVEVRTVGAAGVVADALERAGFRVEPPATEQRDDGSVAVRIFGRYEPAAAKSSQRDRPTIAGARKEPADADGAEPFGSEP